jgi:hypothetical protein
MQLPLYEYDSIISAFSAQNAGDERIMGKSCPFITKIQNYRFPAYKQQTKVLSPVSVLNRGEK